MWWRKLVLVVGLAALAGAFCRSAAAGEVAGPPTYYFQLSDCDGVVSVEAFTQEEAAEKKKEGIEKYKEVMTEWMEQKKEWEKAFGQKKFPLAQPQQPKAPRQLMRVPPDKAAAEKALEKHNRILEKWDVYIVTNCRGERSAEVVRHDKAFSRTRELQKEYVQAVLAAGGGGDKQGGEEKAEGKSDVVTPAMSKAKGPLTSSEAAYEVADKLSAQLEKGRGR